MNGVPPLPMREAGRLANAASAWSASETHPSPGSCSSDASLSVSDDLSPRAAKKSLAYLAASSATQLSQVYLGRLPLVRR